MTPFYTPLIKTRPVMNILLNLFQLSTNNIFIQFFLFPTSLHLCKDCVPNLPQNRSLKPSPLVSDELVAVFLKKLKRSNLQSKRILNNLLYLSKRPSSIPKVVLQNYINHYSFNFLINWWLSVRLCCIFFKNVSLFRTFWYPTLNLDTASTVNL